jgi:hypothetical protein
MLKFEPKYTFYGVIWCKNRAAGGANRTNNHFLCYKTPSTGKKISKKLTILVFLLYDDDPTLDKKRETHLHHHNRVICVGKSWHVKRKREQVFGLQLEHTFQ